MGAPAGGCQHPFRPAGCFAPAGPDGREAVLEEGTRRVPSTSSGLCRICSDRDDLGLCRCLGRLSGFRLILANAARLDDPKPAMDRALLDPGQGRPERGLRERKKRAGEANHDDPGGSSRGESQGIREVQVQGDQGSPLSDRCAKELLVAYAAKLLVADRGDIMATLDEERHQTNIDVLVELESHGRTSTSRGSTRSRVSSAA
jgi:hypothetical protein